MKDHENNAEIGCSKRLLNRESEWLGDNVTSGSVSVLASTSSYTLTASWDVPWLIFM